MSIPEPSEVLRVAKEIEETKASMGELKEKLSQLENEWKSFWIEPSTPSLVTPRKGGRRPDPNSLQGKIAAFLEAEAKSEDYFTAAEVALRMNLDDTESIKPIERALFKLHQSGKIDRPARGRYKAKAKTEAVAA